MIETRITSATKEVIIGGDRPTVIIGERINPSGRKKLQEALKLGDLGMVRADALAQVQAGADILDVNVGMFGVDEAALLLEAVKLVMETVDVPLCIDSANPEALAKALSIYKGRPLINSVSGEEHSLSRVLPLVKEHNAAVIALLQDDQGVPNSTERRLAIAHKIMERVHAAGIPSEDIIIDVLTFSVGADPTSGKKIIEAVLRIKAELNVNLTLAASNLSFGLPDRALLNNAFVAMAIAAGVDCLIVDVSKVRPIILAADLIVGRDRRARRFTQHHREHQEK